MNLIWKYAAKNLLVYRKNHAFTALGLIFGYVGILLLGGYMLRMESYLATQTIYLRSVGNISIWAKNGPVDYFKDPESHLLNTAKAQSIVQKLIENKIEILRSVPILKGTGMVTNGCDHFPVLMTGIDPEDQKWVYSHPQVAEWIPELVQFRKGSGLWTLSSADSPAMIAPPLFAMLNHSGSKNCQNTLMDKKPFLQVYTQPFGGGIGVSDVTLSGQISTGFVIADEASIVISLPVLQRIMNTESFTHLSVFLADPAQTMNALQIAQRLAPADLEVQSYKNANVSEIYVGAMNFVYVMLSFFVVLVCGVVILTVLNSFQIAFMERRSEIATFKAVGFKSRDVRGIFLVEYFFLNTISLTVGGLLAAAACSIIKISNFRFHIPGYANDLQFILTPTLGFSLLVGICFYILVLATCYLLSLQMTKIKIVDLMRNES